MGASVAIEISPGTSIDRAAEDAQRVADRLGIGCEFKFNGVRCLALPGGLPSLLAQRQQEEQAGKSVRPLGSRFATSQLDGASGRPA